MYLMLAIGVDLVPEQLICRVVVVRRKRETSKSPDTERGNGGAEETASAIHGILLSNRRSDCPDHCGLIAMGEAATRQSKTTALRQCPFLAHFEVSTATR
jgi:hypothetical protein